MTETTEKQIIAAPKMDSNIVAGFDTSGGFELMMRIANAFASSTIVPPEYQKMQLQKAKKQSDGSWSKEQWVSNPAAISNCTIATNMALRMGSDPMMVMQNLVIVHGRPSWSAKFLIATVNASKRFSALRFVFSGEEGTDSWGCKAVSTELSTGLELEGMKVTISLSKAEGWYDKNGSKWKTMPQKMLMYRAGAWWCDLYSPELAMGLRTDDEVLDAFDAEPNAQGTYQVKEVEIVNLYGLGSTLSLISDAGTEDELALIKFDGLSAKDQKIARLAWMKKKDEFQPKAQAQALSIADRINACTSAQELNNLIVEINDESVELEHDTLIGEKYDSFR